MKIKNIFPAFFLGFIVVVASACSTAKLSSQTNDDVYFSDITANEVVYTSVKNNTPAVRDNYDENLNYYDEGIYNSRLNGFNNYSWRDYYYQNSGLAFDPYWGSGFNSFNNFYGYGPNNFFNNGWSFNLGFGRPFNGFNNFYGYNNFYSPFNNWNNFNSYYGYGAYGYGYGNIYSYYRPGGNFGYGNFGGNNIYFDPLIDNRPNNPRPRGSYDNVRSGGRPSSGGISMPPSSRPVRPDGVGGSTPTRTVDATRNPSSGTTSVRPTRPTGTSSGTPSGSSTRPTQSTTPRPTRQDSPPTSTPSRNTDSGSSSSSGRSSSSGSSSSGGSSSPRPTRPGGN